MKPAPQKQKGPVAAGPICKSKTTRRDITKLTPRLQRLIVALLDNPQSIRDLMDLIPANNPAAYVEILRKRHGFTVPLEQVRFTTLDGRHSWYGNYHLTPDDQTKAAELLGVGA